MRARRGAPAALLSALLVTAGAAIAAAGDAELASVNGKGKPLDKRAGLTSISANGRFTTFTVDLGLRPRDILPETDVWMYDARRDRGRRVSGGPKNFDAHYDADVSGNGRYTAFASDSEDLVKRRTDGGALSDQNDDIFVYDRKRKRTTWVSRDAGKGGRQAFSPSISADGRYVAFTSNSNNLDVAQDLGSGKDFRIFVYDRKRKKLKLASVTDDNEVPDESAWEPSISGDGRHVTYYSRATNLAGGQSDKKSDVFLYDTRTKDTTLVSAPAGGDGSSGGDGISDSPVVSDDGNLVAFTSGATDLVAADGNGDTADVFVRDIAAGTTSLVSVPEPLVPGGGDGPSTQPSISGDGSYVAFTSAASNLAPGDTNGELDVFRRDLASGVTELISLSIEAPGKSANDHSSDSALSADGQTIAFVSEANDIAPDDGRRADVFVRDLAP